ncbi:MAG TPA: DUF5309 family protein [Tepidisphaeraceae bacterium]|nr:DUF5309 family protein [Tepidisphaeraceae bacterium]
MSFTGKATYSAGSSLPESAEDVSDLVGIVSPFETPLLDVLGDAARAARSTVHEWLEDTLNPNQDTVNQSSFGNPSTDTTVVVSNVGRFAVGDQIRLDGGTEVMLVTAINTGSSQLTITRGYGATTATALSDGATIDIIGNASLEGDDAAPAVFTDRVRKSNYTQIFASTVDVSGSELAVRQIGVADELDYQKQNRLRELMRDLENSVINGRAPTANQQGSNTVRRTMNGVLAFIATNKFSPGVSGFPSDTALTEAQLNLALRSIWQQSSGNVDLIVVGGKEKRAMNQFMSSWRRTSPADQTFANQIAVYDSDFGTCKIVLSRYVPTGTVLLLDSSRVEVMPLGGRSFHYKPLAATGDGVSGQVLGEYTLEFRNENAHGVISGLTT